MSGNLMRTGSPDWWIASSGTYYRVLDHLAEAVTDGEVAERFREASTHGFRLACPASDKDTASEIPLGAGPMPDILELYRTSPARCEAAAGSGLHRFRPRHLDQSGPVPPGHQGSAARRLR
jgi:hypothetical protein